MANERTDSAPAFGLFGVYRYLLASAVMLSHFLSGPWEVIGEYAVFGFFILSGYVVCYILHTSYLRQENGLMKYAANRALRVYPAFFIASFLTLAILKLYYPNHDENQILGYPRHLSWQLFCGWLALNLLSLNSVLLMGFVQKPMLIPAGWSIGIEIFFWTLMPLFLVRSRVRLAATAFAIIYALYIISLSLSLHPIKNILILRYFSPMAGMLPFCVGLWWFLWRKKKDILVPHWLGLAAITLLSALMLGGWHLFAEPYFSGFYLSFLLNAVIVLYLCRFDQRHSGKFAVWANRLGGDLAFPIFLMHVFCSLLVSVWLPDFKAEHSGLFVCLLVLVTNVLAWALHRVVEIPVNRIRQHIKNRKRLNHPESSSV